MRRFTTLFKEQPIMSERTQERKNAVRNDADHSKEEPDNDVIESMFVCNMSALNEEERRQHLAVTEKVRGSVRGTDELPDGYAFRFDTSKENILLLSEFIARERLCCQFFAFDLVVEPEGGPLLLRLHGREGVKAFVRAEMGML
ncbi:MAG: hypothetical protein ACRD4L_03615, partial [Pyrinomonadaceae bacterium]